MKYKLLQVGFAAIAFLLLSKYGDVYIEDALYLTLIVSMLILSTLIKPKFLQLGCLAIVLMFVFGYSEIEIETSVFITISFVLLMSHVRLSAVTFGVLLLIW